MSGLYPTLEDLKVDEIHQAQKVHLVNELTYPQPSMIGGPTNAVTTSLYPSLSQYMGFDMNDPEVREAVAVYTAPSANNAVVKSSSCRVVAPITKGNIGIVRSEIKQGLTQVILCKDAKGLLGIRVQNVDNGIFVSFIAKDSPAAMGGLRFGDQIVEINGATIAGWSRDKTMSFIKKADAARVQLIIRERPFERIVTINKDSSGLLGFTFLNGKITNLVKDSSAARNGLLTNHHLCEVDGQCVVGMKDEEIADVFAGIPSTGTVTIIPSFLYEHIVRKIGSSLFKKQDHSIPDV